VVIEVVVAASVNASHGDGGHHIHGSSTHSWSHKAHEASELRLDRGTLSSAEPEGDSKVIASLEYLHGGCLLEQEAVHHH